MNQHIKTLTLLFIANSISGFAQGITMLSIPWYLVSQLGNENGKFYNALIIGTTTLLSLFWGLYAGTLIDKYNRKHIFLILNLVSCLILGSIALYGFYSQGQLPVWMIALVFLQTIFNYNVHYPNLYAFAQELFPPEMYAKVNSGIEIQGQLTNFLGMTVGALLIGGTKDLPNWIQFLEIKAWNLPEIFLLDCSTYCIALLLISLIPYRPNPNRTIDTGNILERLQNGFSFLKNKPNLIYFGLSSYSIFFSILVFYQTILPIYVKDYLNAQVAVVALSEAWFALGALSAGVTVLSASRWIKKQDTVILIKVLLLVAAVL
ncbi:MAG: MFS transporter, partial [Bacteroidia bacterium]|nr:MFS transporter [Bacteroidia bacterium]